MGSLTQSQPTSSHHSADMNGFDHPEQIRELASAQQTFAEHADSLPHPEVAMSEYARYIHEHTKAQLARAARAGSTSSSSGVSLSETSSRGESISSNGS
jgi:hypothetical protein